MSAEPPGQADTRRNSFRPGILGLIAALRLGPTRFNFKLVCAIVCASFVMTARGAAAGEGGAVDATRLGTIVSLRIAATGQRFEPLHNITPYGPPRHVCDYQLTTTWVPAHDDWTLFTLYRVPNNWTFAAVYHRNAGYCKGRDGFRPSAEGAVAPARIGAVFRDLWLAGPLRLAHGNVLLPETARRRGRSLRRRIATLNGSSFEVLSDPRTGLPAEVASRERDPA